MTLEHVERERNYCSVAHELKVPFTAVDANCSKCSRARESRLVRLSKECKHEQHGRRVVAISGRAGFSGGYSTQRHPSMDPDKGRPESPHQHPGIRIRPRSSPGLNAEVRNSKLPPLHRVA